MSELGWAAIAVVLLVVVGWFFWLVWHGGEEPNGLKGELEARVTELENDRVSIWKELRRQGNKWIP